MLRIAGFRVKKLGKKQLRMIHKVDFDQVRRSLRAALSMRRWVFQIKDSRIGVGMRTAFGGSSPLDSSGCVLDLGG